MIDIENDVYSTISAELTQSFPQITITNVYESDPPEFPFVSIMEMNNVTQGSEREAAGQEAFASVLYEANVYSDTYSDGKEEAKDIAAVIDSEFMKLGFARTLCKPIPYTDAQSFEVYRIVLQYCAVVSSDGVVYNSYETVGQAAELTQAIQNYKDPTKAKETVTVAP